MKQSSFVMLLAVLSAPGLLRAGEIDSDLAAKLEQANPDDVISTLVHLNDRVDPSVLTQQLDDRKAPTAERHETLVRALRQKAQATQPQLVAHLNQLQSEGRIADFEAFWIANVIRVDAVPDEIITLSERNDVQRVYFNYPIEGYFHWTLVDNFEWHHGWTQRFGLWELDINSQKRTKRTSAELYEAICKENGLSSQMVEKYAPVLLSKMFPGMLNTRPPMV